MELPSFLNAVLPAIVIPFTLLLIIPHINAYLTRLKRTSRTFLRSPKRPDIAKHEILSAIVPHLSRTDLVSCCLTSRLFFEVASKALYGMSEGVLAGQHRYYAWSGDAASPPRHVVTPVFMRSLFGGQRHPSDEDITNPDILRAIHNVGLKYPPFKGFVPFLPSELKMKLLRHMRHLIYATDSPNEFDTFNSFGWFPSLHTLTIQEVDPPYNDPCWELPFLSGLRPIHIRLTHIRTLGSQYGAAKTYILDTPLGSWAERVTIHFVDCDAVSRRGLFALTVQWPAHVKHIDLVFAAPVSDTRSCAPWDVPLYNLIPSCPPSFSQWHPELVTQTIALILRSAASTGAAIRVVGLGSLATPTINPSLDEAPTYAGMRRVLVERALLLQKDPVSKFTTELLKQYGEALREGGSGAAEVEEKVGKLEFVSMEEYRQEVDYAPF